MFNKIKYKLLSYKWDLAYGEYLDSILETGFGNSVIHYIKNPYRHKWFADPFILDYNDKVITLLVEEYDYNIKRGRIAKIIIDRKTDSIVKCDIVLDLSTHLSFPAIYKINGEIYVHPENSASGQSTIYRYDSTQNKLVDPVVILKEPLTDAVIFEEKGYFYMYATKLPVPNGGVLYEYRSKSFFGPYEFVREHLFSKSIARMAGAMIKTNNGNLIRPAQDCEGGDYGKAVLLLSKDRELSKLSPIGKKYAGLHTFNQLGDLYIIDLKYYVYPWLYRIKTRIKR